ncbi:3'-5' exonuclease [Acinetobacter junii]|uniref:3'-5' exonuclease n=1 Tax=Acinetobacter junii TaxID=40215 RepID=UPI001FB4AD36|nr:3'-5' exonuclease [Acinetobacter junii]UOB51283.1 3'-5' exonuclease [Acinetobacter junii]
MLCFFDVETTGVNLFQDHAIEIGAILVDDKFKIVKEFHSFIKPDRTINFSNASKKVHGLQEEFFYDKSDSEKVLKSFFREMGFNYRFVSWNIAFDVGFFRKLCHLNGVTDKFNKINYRHIDLQSIFYWYCMQNNINNLSSLDDACSYFNIQRSEFHNAYEDAYIAYMIFLNLNKNSL